MSEEISLDKTNITIDLVEAIFEHAKPIVGCHTCDGILTIGQQDIVTGEEDSKDKYALGLKLMEVLDKYNIQGANNE